MTKKGMTQARANLVDADRLLRAGKPRDALPLLESAILGTTSVGPAHTLHLQALMSLGQRREALAAHDRAMKLTATSAEAVDALAFYARLLDRHELSNTLYKRATELAPGDPQQWYNLATSERTLGRLEEASAACDRALTLDPNLRPAVLLRSEVTRATPSANNVTELKARIAASGGSPDATYLFYALGKELHELGEYDDAFAAFARGARTRRLSLRYDVAQDEAKLKRIAEAYPIGVARSQQGPIGRHIFIVGLPRSGTTLVERILGGLPNVVSNNETNNFSVALFRAAPDRGGDVFERAARAEDSIVAREYEALAVPDGFSGKLIEKLPFNYLYVGPILRAFPNTPILWVRRNPVDTCFAMFRTMFGTAYPFSYDFADLARYYAAYERLMRHWQTQYPGQMTSIDYEDLVAAPDLVAPRVAASCGIPWTEQALDITQNRTVSLTASAAQIRQGIYSTSSGIWRQYERHLVPLVDRLRTSGVIVDIP
jgi:tetratricopeptide (TPR) repeat protein